MGFMDKAKKLAEQAQQKLDEAQTQFNQGASDIVMSRGVVVVRDGTFTGAKGNGRFVKRAPADFVIFVSLATSMRSGLSNGVW